MKNKVKYVCNECGYSTSKWLGKCPNCDTWGAIEEEVQIKINNINSKRIQLRESNLSNIDDIKYEKDFRIKSDFFRI